MKTIKDIAKEANVSPGTVDRVIHNRPGVSPKTKIKIQRLLEKYSFERNLIASTLAYKRNYKIVTVVPFSRSNMGFWHEPNKGIKAAIREINRYKVTTQCLYFDKYDPQSYRQVLAEVLELNPDGVVLAPFFYGISKEFVKELSQKDIPFVLVNIDIESPDSLTFIGQDSYQSGLMSGKLLNLLLNEQDQVALVRGRKNVDSHHAIDARTKGFLDYFNLINGSRSIMEITLEEISPDEIKKVLTFEFRKNNHIKGIFVPSTAAYAVAQFLEQENLTHMRLVGFDGHENNLKYLKTGTIDFLIDQDPFEQGYLAVKVLFNYLLFNKKPKSKYSSPINILTKENIGFFRKPNEAELIA